MSSQSNNPFSDQPVGATSQIKCICPFCSAQLAMEASHSGKTVACPKCSANFQAPLLQAQPMYVAGSGPDSLVREFASRKIPAGLCAILLGNLGIHKFILGLNTAGIIMLVLTLSCSVLASCLIFPILVPIGFWVVGIVEGIMYFTKSDEEFYQAYAVEKREWF